MRIIATTGVSDQDRMHRLWELGNDMVALLDRENISQAELMNCNIYEPIPSVGVIDIYVCGDWKHDLLRAQYLIKENFKIIKSEVASLEDTGSDWGPEQQTYYVYLED